MKLMHRQIYKPRQKQCKNFQIRFPEDLEFKPGHIYLIKIFEMTEEDSDD